jgi:DNA-directed RNA polymerase subunit RPC12/RpoP
MRFVMRFWKCGECGRPNKTIALDGTVKCEYCTHTKRFELIGARASQPPRYVNRSAR